MSLRIKVGQAHGGFLPAPQTSGPWRIVAESVRGEECTVLYRGEHEVWMDDSESSVQEHEPLVKAAAGKKIVVVTGLGIGFVAPLIAHVCERLIIVENDPHIIRMVWPCVNAAYPNVELIEADANTYVPDWADVYWYDHTFTPATVDEQEAERNRLAGHVGELLFWQRVG